MKGEDCGHATAQTFSFSHFPTRGREVTKYAIKKQSVGEPAELNAVVVLELILSSVYPLPDEFTFTS